MFSPRDSETVLDEVGSKFLGSLVRATRKAREDLAAMRAWQPGWFPAMFEREVAGIIHTRLWSHLCSEVEGVDGISVLTREPHREVSVHTPMGRTYVMRVKRHSERDRISSYPTLSDVHFWSGGVPTFEGLETINLAAGYRWEAETRSVGQVVVSYREGKDNVIWAYEVEEGTEGGAMPLVYTPILPELPAIDLLQASTDEAAEDGRR